ncbi:hypothetical protein SK3146_06784 [Paenibacillus konkukensis]|uniref:IrrE N-terminal-like domain-containing protein n=1 Tax=Paenibacillus konkukensis TaxID=2020716 RepID=A0ABY4RZC8_9BACL|nr:ImmA/IrrE family metallo-endopeptidase [Paenibacillus konkukensis]UQZ87482.1 hypothetical protein SK3146_06784 [Paenibacillus konkukensis]
MSNKSRYITNEQMESVTMSILTDYGYDPHDKVIRPVPIEELVEFHFDLQIIWEAIDHLDQDGMVMAAIFPTEKRIVLNETHRELFDSKLGTYHFTLAHELGHWVLHTTQTSYRLRSQHSFSPESGDSPVYCRSLSQKPAIEVQADLFAGCLLMPRPMLERAVGQLRRIGRIQLFHLYRLADCFGVSISALTVRLAQLQLLIVGQEGQITWCGAPKEQKAEQLIMDF